MKMLAHSASVGEPVGQRTDTPITLTIVIAVYNTRELLADCLASIVRNPPHEPYEIIVVDDASTDGSYEMTEALWPNVILLKNESNHHYAYSNNRGLKRARGQFVLLLNSDTVIVSRALDDMVDFLRNNPGAGVVGCKLLNEDGSIQWSVKSLPCAHSALFGARSLFTRLLPTNRQSRKHLLHFDNDMTEAFAVDGYVSSAACVIPRDVIQKVGHLDLRLAYHVDADYCKRITDAGYKCYYYPTASIIHLNHKGGTLANTKARVRSLILFETQSYIFFQKHYQKSKWDPMQLAAAIGLGVHFAFSAIALAVEELVLVTRSRPQASSKDVWSRNS